MHMDVHSFKVQSSSHNPEGGEGGGGDGKDVDQNLENNSTKI